ncbi:MAG TPA: regulatory protein RecX [Bacteroidota bacterium]|nr:regulatory protein RecX [Bacteroidota bacterium]
MELKIIKIQKTTRKNLYKITFDNDFEIQLYTEILLKFKLRTGDIIEEKDLKDILLQNQIYEAKNTSLRLLSKRMRTEKEIIDKLKQKKFEDSIITQTINELKRINLINDEEFVDKFINNTITLNKNYGRYALLNKLIKFGISKSLANEKLSKLLTDNDEYETALNAAKKKLINLKRYDESKKIQRLISFLSGRGYNWDIIKKVLSELKINYE